MQADSEREYFTLYIRLGRDGACSLESGSWPRQLLVFINLESNRVLLHADNKWILTRSDSLSVHS